MNVLVSLDNKHEDLVLATQSIYIDSKLQLPPRTGAVSTSPTSTPHKICKPEVLAPGLVLLRNFVPETECERIAQQAQSLGQHEKDGFYLPADASGERRLNTGQQRGRIYDAATYFPSNWTGACVRAVQAARAADGAMPVMNCTHVLLNMYTTTEGLVWHRDIYENDGRSDHPVVNLCVGAACTFGYKPYDDDVECRVRLRSGDVLLFGGPRRLMPHAVLEVHLDDCPQWMTKNWKQPCRFSLTFRDSPEVLGRESEFKYFRIKDHLVGQETFQAPKDPKVFRGLPNLKSQKFGEDDTRAEDE